MTDKVKKILFYLWSPLKKTKNLRILNVNVQGCRAKKQELGVIATQAGASQLLLSQTQRIQAAAVAAPATAVSNTTVVLVFSSSAPVTSGVPQGTVIGPLLFLTYINDLPDAISHSKTKLFADDSMLQREIKTEEDQTKLQEDLDALEIWERDWQMNFNPTKCTAMSINCGNQEPILGEGYSLHSQKLEHSKSSKYLGVTIAEDMKWNQHIGQVAAKGHRTVGFLRRNFCACSAKAKATTYTTMVRPVLEYASTVWDPSSSDNIKELEKVQRSASRYVFNNYKDRTPGTITGFLQRLQWETLESRREQARLAMLYKINKGLVDLNPSCFYKKSDSRTRGDKVFQERNKNPAFTNSFFPKTMSQWNKLPPKITKVKSLEVFRHSVGCHLQTHTLSKHQ